MLKPRLEAKLPYSKRIQSLDDAFVVAGSQAEAAYAKALIATLEGMAQEFESLNQ